ncbi:MAG: PAS domain-containing protein [Desulfobacteraceae bacterium]|nr:PAS domain-containing protein [Desulfobacteraceae bacterium]
MSDENNIERALLINGDKYRRLFNEMVVGASLLEIAAPGKKKRPIDFRIVEVNSAFEDLTGIPRDRAVGRTIRELWPKTEALWFDQIDQAMRSNRRTQAEGFHLELGKYFLVSAFRLDDRTIGATFIDISAHKKIEAALDNTRRALENTVRARTAGLRVAIRKLRSEVTSRRLAQQALINKTHELEVRSAGLEEANIALKILLKENQNGRRKLEEKVICNLNELIQPHLAKLAAGRLSPRQKVILETINRGLDDITSPMSRRLIIGNSHLTPMETQVANLIRKGNSTKEIAELLGVAVSTIDFHRLNIRRRLKLTNKQINLRSYLRSLE